MAHVDLPKRSGDYARRLICHANTADISPISRIIISRRMTRCLWATQHCARKRKSSRHAISTTLHDSAILPIYQHCRQRARGDYVVEQYYRTPRQIPAG